VTHFEEHGRGPAVVMVSGLAATRTFFRDAVKDLSADHRVVTVELPGHGDTPLGGRPATVQRAAEDLGRVLEELDLRDVTLLGWSLGATVAYACLEHAGTDRVSRLVSVEQTPRLTVAPDWTHAAFGGLDEEGAKGLRGSLTEDFAGFAQTLVGSSFAAGSQPAQDITATLLAEAGACDPAAVASLLADAVSQDWRGRVADISVPTLLIHGARSQVYPTPVGEWLARTIPGARLEMFADSGHLPFIEETERFTGAVRAFADH
jgi:pimeloyl-ACP methyl ester carboxylesterase